MTLIGSGIPLFIAAQVNASGVMPLYLGAPLSGELTGDKKLFIRGVILSSEATAPLYLHADQPSGIFTLNIRGASDMYPKGWSYARRGDVDSDGYFPIGNNITVFINGN